MKPRRRTRSIVLGVLALSCVLGCVRLGQTWHQAQLNHELTLAVFENPERALQLVNAGADPNTRYVTSKPLTLDETLRRLFHRRRTPTSPTHPVSALAIAVTMLVQGTGDGTGPDLRYHPLIAAMLQHGGDCSQTDYTGKSNLAHVLEVGQDDLGLLMVERGADVNRGYQDCEYPYPAADFYVAHLDLLRQHGLKPTIGSARGTSLLACFCFSHAKEVSEAQRVAGVKQLLIAGVSPNDLDQWGYTPLMWAAKRGDIALVQCLLENGAMVNIRSIWRNNGYSAPDNGHMVLELILRDIPIGRHALDETDRQTLKRNYHKIVALLQAAGAR